MKTVLIVCLTFLGLRCVGQLVPSAEENIPFLVTFGKEAEVSYGDDDFNQTFFFRIPKDYNRPFFIRIYDPEIGGNHDEIIGSANTQTKFSLYGGKGCFTHPDSKNVNPIGDYKKGNLLHTKTFGSSSTYDSKWYNIGPINPSEGEYVEELESYVFKLIAEGISGNDGNLYRYYLSSLPIKNVPIEDGNAFTYEYSIRLHDNFNEVSHIYPYVDQNVISLKQHNFDWDSDGSIVIYSVKKIAEKVETSKDGNWKTSLHKIFEEEKGSCVDFQLIKNKSNLYEHNNVVFYVTNQYGDLMPFFSVPIGIFHPTNRKIKVE